MPLGRLRSEYRLKARDPEARTGIPTLEEYLRACVEAHLLPFIELKLDGPTELVQRVLELADDIVGRGGYVMTSNGRVNRTIRRLGIHDVPLMDILYQAPSFADVAALGEVTVAISATRYARAEHLGFVDRARGAGLATELHADDVESFTIAEDHGVDLISTDVLAPDLAPGAPVLLSVDAGDDAIVRSPTARGSRCALPAARLRRHVPRDRARGRMRGAARAAAVPARECRAAAVPAPGSRVRRDGGGDRDDRARQPHPLAAPHGRRVLSGRVVGVTRSSEA
ncbi:hypothetical protein [Homoserinibacter gongjuensis]|uniref:hypothetical protein n=1 Tax=Homoserinibacter gongjuensis TaxID=1162968 RepID=UPI0024E07F05|nr:hypothetical protein [Homoserinibacter gongjuensis]